MPNTAKQGKTALAAGVRINGVWKRVGDLPLPKIKGEKHAG